VKSRHKELLLWSRRRVTPRHITEGLRLIHPAAELLYLRDGRWQLVELRWNSDAVRKATAIVGRAYRSIAQHVAQSKSGGAITIDTRSRDRLETFLLGMQGARLVGAPYVIQGEPTSTIVEDYQRMTWLYLHTTDEELYTAVEAPREKRIKDTRADLTDPARGRDAWRYGFTVNVGIASTISTTQPLPSSRKRHLTISHSSQQVA
jgi:hypothetical protein